MRIGSTEKSLGMKIIFYAEKNMAVICLSRPVVECWFNKICLLKDNALLEIGNNSWNN